MTLTRDASLTIVERAQREPEFSRLMLDEAASMLLNGEADGARMILAMMLTATNGFKALAQKTALPVERLQVLLSDDGNPDVAVLVAAVDTVQQQLGVHMRGHSVATDAQQAGIESKTQIQPDAA